MKEALLKKRYGIPAALLLVLVLSVFSGAAVAWYSVATISSETTVKEHLSIANEYEFSATMSPGDTNTWYWDIENSGDVVYKVRADLSFDAPNGVSITYFNVSGTNMAADLTDNGTAIFSVDTGTTSCSMTIRATNEAEPGKVSVSLELSRA